MKKDRTQKRVVSSSPKDVSPKDDQGTSKKKKVDRTQ